MARPTLEEDPFPRKWDWDKVRDWFERRLKQQQAVGVPLLAYRMALRGKPQLRGLLEPDTSFNDNRLIEVLRCYSTNLAAIKHSQERQNEIGIALEQSINGGRFYNSYGASGSVAAAAAAFTSARAAQAMSLFSESYDSILYKATTAVARGADASARSTRSMLLGRTSYTAAAFEQDCKTLEKFGREALLIAPLWPNYDNFIMARYEAAFASVEPTHLRGGLPLEYRSALSGYLEVLRNLSGDFRVWTEWYAGILEGEKNGTYLFGLPTERALRLNIDFALIDDALWKGDPAALHAEMRRLVEVARGEVLPSRIRPPLPNLKSAFSFQWTEAGLLRAIPGPLAEQRLPQRVTPELHAKNIQSFVHFAHRSLTLFSQQGAGMNDDYIHCLNGALQWLPNDNGEGNIVIADGEMRSLRNLFYANRETIGKGAASTLKTTIEAFQAVRAGYPELKDHYDLVRSGIVDDPLLDGEIDKIYGAISEDEGTLFERGTRAKIDAHTIVEAPPPPEGAVGKEHDVLVPPADPLGEIDAQKSQRAESVGTINAIVETLEKVDKAGNSVEGIATKTGNFLEKISGSFNSIIEKLTAAGGGGPPDFPPIIGA